MFTPNTYEINEEAWNEMNELQDELNANRDIELFIATYLVSDIPIIEKIDHDFFNEADFD